MRSSCLEMNEAVPRTSSVGLELACIGGMTLGKVVSQGKSFSIQNWGEGGAGIGISSLSKDLDQKSWGAYHELMRNVTSFTSSFSDDQT